MSLTCCYSCKFPASSLFWSLRNTLCNYQPDELNSLSGNHQQRAPYCILHICIKSLKFAVVFLLEIKFPILTTTTQGGSTPFGARSCFHWKLHPSTQAWPLLSTSNCRETAIAKCGNWWWLTDHGQILCTKNPWYQMSFKILGKSVLSRCWQDKHHILTIINQQGAQQGIWGPSQ